MHTNIQGLPSCMKLTYAAIMELERKQTTKLRVFERVCLRALGCCAPIVRMQMVTWQSFMLPANELGSPHALGLGLAATK